LYHIITEYVILGKLVTLIKIRLNETCSKVDTCKNLLDELSIPNGLKQDDLLSLLFNFAL